MVSTRFNHWKEATQRCPKLRHPTNPKSAIWPRPPMTSAGMHRPIHTGWRSRRSDRGPNTFPLHLAQRRRRASREKPQTKHTQRDQNQRRHPTNTVRNTTEATPRRPHRSDRLPAGRKRRSPCLRKPRPVHRRRHRLRGRRRLTRGPPSRHHRRRRRPPTRPMMTLRNRRSRPRRHHRRVRHPRRLGRDRQQRRPRIRRAAFLDRLDQILGMRDRVDRNGHIHRETAIGHRRGGQQRPMGLPAPIHTHRTAMQLKPRTLDPDQPTRITPTRPGLNHRRHRARIRRRHPQRHHQSQPRHQQRTQPNPPTARHHSRATHGPPFCHAKLKNG